MFTSFSAIIIWLGGVYQNRGDSLFKSLEATAPTEPPANGPDVAPGATQAPIDLTTKEPGILYFGLSPEAQEAFKRCRAEAEEDKRPGGQFEHIPEWAEKYPGAVARIAAILHAVEHVHDIHTNTRISRETMNAAIFIGEYLADHALVAFSMMGASPAQEAAQHVLNWIPRQGKPAFSLRDAHQALKGRYSEVSQVAGALQLLEDYGYVQALPPPTTYGPGRKPSPRYVAHPEILAQYSQN